MIAPSDSLRALETSLEKSTWPGESIKLTRYDLSSNCGFTGYPSEGFGTLI
jgi:NADPH-dependent 7-cyano-7-deazaguanine reductase QueF